MAEKQALEKFLTCSVCLDTFEEPVSLGCNHSFCSSCIQDYWEKNQTRNCPVCKRRSSKELGVNFALKELCESFTGRLDLSERSQTEGGEQSEGAESSEKQRKPEQLQSELQTLRAEKRSYEELEETYKEINQFCQKQAVQSERLIRAEFSRLQSFLQEEEQRALSALREEQLRQKKDLCSELQEVRKKLSALSSSIQELEKHLPTGETSTRPKRLPQQTAPRLRPKAGLLLDQANILGNLGFRVWSNMRSIVSYSPVILDPNTADDRLYLSEDLRGVRRGDQRQKIPDNRDRFSKYPEVLGSEGFSSGIHQWDVEVGDLPHWTIGVAKESVERKGERTDSPKDGVWVLVYYNGKYTNGSGVQVPVETCPERVRVKLDYDLGEVSFYDADHMTLLYTHSDTFTEKLFPFFILGKADEAETKELRVLPCAAPQTH